MNEDPGPVGSKLDGSRAAVELGSGIPFYVWTSLVAISAAVLGVQWDIAWHRSIGRDTFWSPPHIAIYLGGVLAGFSCGYLILRTTFSRAPEAARARDGAVRIWGFYGPLGAFLSSWGGLAMLASAPFDDWWHNTYGLDVKILSPPHTVLALGILGVELGALILIAGACNRVSERSRGVLRTVFLMAGGLLLVGLLTFEMEFIGRVLQHGAAFYRAVAIVAPALLIGVGQGSGHRFGATITALVYSAILLLLLWVFPLVHTTPKLGPVYYPTTHLIPAGFPLLLVAPALVIDLVRPSLAQRSSWVAALVLGALFLAVLLMVQWPMADFLMSPASRNWVFGSNHHSYDTRPDWSSLRHVYRPTEHSVADFRLRLAGALTAAIVSARLGLGWASFLGQLRR